MNLETLLTHEDGFALTTASPAQRAICRIIDGEPLAELADHPDVIALVGGEDAIALLPQERPEQVDVIAAVRSAKTIIMVAAAVRASQTVDLTGIRPGEIPRFVLLSLTKDHAHAAFSHLVGTLSARPVLRSLMVGKPTSDTVTLRHPSGKHVEICVQPLTEAGGSVVSRWLIGLGVDEYPRMPFDGVVRVQDVVSAARGRLLPGAQILCIGSPWAPAGPAYEEFVHGFGRPSQSLVVLRGTGPMLNPHWWTPERCAKLEKSDPIAYRADVLGEFVDAESAFLDSRIIEHAGRLTEERPLPPNRVAWAGADLATRTNGCTLVISWLDYMPSGKVGLVIGFAREWRAPTGGALPLASLFAEWKQILRRYNLRGVTCDQWSFDAARELAASKGVLLVQGSHEQRQNMYQALERFVREEAIELPPNQLLSRDLIALRRKPTPTGYKIELPRTPDGRHCDYAPSIALSAMLATTPIPPRTYRHIPPGFVP